MRVLSLTHCHSFVMEARWTCSCKTINMCSSSCLTFLLLVLTKVRLLFLSSCISLTTVFWSLYGRLFTFLQTFNSTTNYIILVFNTTLCFEPFGYDVPLLTIYFSSHYSLYGVIFCTCLIVSHDIVLALSRKWTFYCLVVFLSSYWGSWKWWQRQQ